MQLFDEKSLFLVRKKLTLNDITQFTQVIIYDNTLNRLV